MTKFNQFITARRISLGLILGLACLMYLSTIIPQQLGSSSEKIAAWRQGHENLLWLIDVAKLHHMYSQPWFAILVLCAALSLGASSIDQVTIARRKLTAIGSGEELATSIPEQELRTIARAYGYRFGYAGKESDRLKFIKYPWGYFGVVLLHVGLTLVILASSYVALTSRQGALILVEGVPRNTRLPWDISEHGVLTSNLQLPGSIRLDKVQVVFDEKQQPKEVTSHVVFSDDAGQTEALTTSINRIQHYRGLRIYHSSQYGDAFNVRFTDNHGIVHTEQIAAQQPINPTTAGYSNDFGVLWSPNLLSAKYFADADKKSMLSDNPQLTLRMTTGGKELARTTLTKGSTGVLGEYQVELLSVQKWSKLLFVDISGMSIVFTGFAIIMLGGLIHYMTPPRELIGIRQSDGTWQVLWKATAFREFYQEEHDDLKDEFMRGALC